MRPPMSLGVPFAHVRDGEPLLTADGPRSVSGMAPLPAGIRKAQTHAANATGLRCACNYGSWTREPGGGHGQAPLAASDSAKEDRMV